LKALNLICDTFSNVAYKFYFVVFPVNIQSINFLFDDRESSYSKKN